MSQFGQKKKFYKIGPWRRRRWSEWRPLLTRSSRRRLASRSSAFPRWCRRCWTCRWSWSACSPWKWRSQMSLPWWAVQVSPGCSAPAPGRHWSIWSYSAAGWRWQSRKPAPWSGSRCRRSQNSAPSRSAWKWSLWHNFCLEQFSNWRLRQKKTVFVSHNFHDVDEALKIDCGIFLFLTYLSFYFVMAFTGVTNVGKTTNVLTGSLVED